MNEDTIKAVYYDNMKDATPIKQPLEKCTGCLHYDQSTCECYLTECEFTPINKTGLRESLLNRREEE